MQTNEFLECILRGLHSWHDRALPHEVIKCHKEIQPGLNDVKKLETFFMFVKFHFSYFMKHTFFFILACVMAHAKAQPSESIKVPGIPKNVTWDIKPRSYKILPTGIEITAGRETDFYCFADGSYYVNTAPKLLFTPDTDFIFSAKLKPDFKSLYDGGAILVYSDTLNWAKLLFEKHDDGTYGLGASFVSEKRGDDSYHVTANGNEVYVKVAKSGNIFCFYYALDGKNWKLLRTIPYHKLVNMRIGFYAQSPKGESCTVAFEDIQYKAQKFTNFFTGE